MKAIINFYSKRSNPFTIISAILAVASFVLRIIDFNALNNPTAATCIWLGWLPCAAVLFFALELIFCGKDRLYMTIIPAEMMTLSFIIWSIIANEMLIWIPSVVIALCGGVLYLLVVCGKLKKSWLILIPYGLLSIYFIGISTLQTIIFSGLGLSTFGSFAWSSSALMLSLFSAALSMKPRYDDGSYVRKWGDRSDGRKVRTLSPMFTVSPYIMVERNDASNFFKDSFEITNVEKYIRRKRQEGLINFGIMHVILAAYVRAIAKFPGINRFINGQKIFSRDGAIEINMSIKKEMSTESPDTVIKVDFLPTDTAEDVYRKMNEKIEEVKNTPLDSGFDNLAKMINYIPGLFLKFVVFMLKLLDYFGLLPRMLTKLSPFHGSMFITSMGSLGIPPIYHHIYNFGNVPVFCSFGCKRTAKELDSEGNLITRKYVDWAWVTDERICDGFYFATALKYIKRIMVKPEILDDAPEEITADRA